MPSITEKRFGRDAALPGLGQSVVPTLTGDWPSIAGQPNLKVAVKRRISTVQGTMTHRPLYGAGLRGEVERPSTRVQAARLVASINDNIQRESRVDRVEVAIQDNTETRAARAGSVYLDVVIYPKGDDETLVTSTEF